MAILDVTAPPRADNSYASTLHSLNLSTMDLDAIVHRIADINAALVFLDFSRKNRARLAALADERAELRMEIERACRKV